ncbi:translation initiation factor 2 subunit beta (aeIF-2b), partial [Corchorus olitorius]
MVPMDSACAAVSVAPAISTAISLENRIGLPDHFVGLHVAGQRIARVQAVRARRGHEHLPFRDHARLGGRKGRSSLRFGLGHPDVLVVDPKLVAGPFNHVAGAAHHHLDERGASRVGRAAVPAEGHQVALLHRLVALDRIDVARQAMGQGHRV